MSSVPREVLRDILHPLDRWTLDSVQFTNRRFLQVIMESMADVCFREFEAASFRAPSQADNTYRTTFLPVGGRPEQKTQSAENDADRLFSEFLQALRSSKVASLTISGLVFTPELVEVVLQTPILADALNIDAGRCAELTPTQFHQLLLHFAPTSLQVKTCRLHSSQITDESLRALSKAGVRFMRFLSLVPVDGRRFPVSDDAIVEFLVQQDAESGEDGDEAQPWDGELQVSNGSFTKNLFKRLLEASSASPRTRSIRIAVSPSPVEEQDLHDFAAHLSHRSDELNTWVRIYDFPGEPRGAGAAMHLQAVLRWDTALEVFRARRPYLDFYLDQ